MKQKMTKLGWLFAFIAMIPFLCFMSTTVVSCDRVEQSTTTVDSTTQVNPQAFTSVEQVMSTYKHEVEEYEMNQVFLDIPEPILRQVAAVSFKKYTEVTKDILVMEYLNNRKIYDNLPVAKPESTESEEIASPDAEPDSTTTIADE